MGLEFDKSRLRPRYNTVSNNRISCLEAVLEIVTNRGVTESLATHSVLSTFEHCHEYNQTCPFHGPECFVKLALQEGTEAALAQVLERLQAPEASDTDAA